MRPLESSSVWTRVIATSVLATAQAAQAEAPPVDVAEQGNNLVLAARQLPQMLVPATLQMRLKDGITTPADGGVIDAYVEIASVRGESAGRKALIDLRTAQRAALAAQPADVTASEVLRDGDAPKTEQLTAERDRESAYVARRHRAQMEAAMGGQPWMLFVLGNR